MRKMIGHDLLDQLQVGAGENDGEWIVVCSQNPIVTLDSKGDRRERNLELGRLAGIRHASSSHDGWWISGPESSYNVCIHEWG